MRSPAAYFIRGRAAVKLRAQVDSCWLPWTRPEPLRCWHWPRCATSSVSCYPMRPLPPHTADSIRTGVTAEPEPGTVILASHWAPQAGATSQAAVDWSILLPVSRISLTREGSERSSMSAGTHREDFAGKLVASARWKEFIPAGLTNVTFPGGFVLDGYVSRTTVAQRSGLPLRGDVNCWLLPSSHRQIPPCTARSVHCELAAAFVWIFKARMWFNSRNGEDKRCTAVLAGVHLIIWVVQFYSFWLQCIHHRMENQQCNTSIFTWNHFFWSWFVFEFNTFVSHICIIFY